MFVNNFASVSGVVRVIDNGHYEIYNSQIYNNYASQSPISEMFDSVFTSVIDNSTMYNNIALTYDEIVEELNQNCYRLCFVSDTYKQFTLNSDQNIFAATSHAMFQLISASLNIQNSSNITQQNSILNLFFSNVTITDSSITDINMIESSMTITSSVLSLFKITVSDVNSSDDHYLIFVTLDSVISTNNLNFSDSESNLLNIVDAE